MNKPNEYFDNVSEGTDDQSGCLEALKLSPISDGDHSVGNDTGGYTIDGLHSMHTSVGDTNINCRMDLMPLGHTVYIILK